MLEVFAVPASRVALLCLVAMCACAVVAESASADPYVADFCRTPGFAPFASTFIPTPFGGVASNQCGLADPSRGYAINVPASPMPTSSTADVSLTVPGTLPDIHVEHVLTQWRTVGTAQGQGFASIYTDTGNTVSDVTHTSGATHTDDLVLRPGTRDVKWDLLCAAAPCPVASLDVLTVIQARLTLNESVPPTLSASGGALLGAGPKSGVLPLSYGAADADSGVASVTVSLDATVAGTTTYPCPHDGWNACPLSPGTDVVQVDTTKVPDGPHAVVVTVRDAANNAVTRSVGAITVSNPAGPGPVVLGGPNGTTASRLAKLTVAYTTTRKRSRTLHIGSRPTIRGTLVDEHGAAITAARIAILQRLRQTGASTTQVATVQTGADGGFSYKLDGGPSRTITAAYTAFGGDPKPATSAALLTNVRAIVTGSISPKAPRAGSRVTLSGRLGLLPRKGVQITIQARNHGRWDVVGATRTLEGGRFRWHHVFSASQRGRRFTLRARAASPIYPFAAGTSKPVGLRLR